MNLAVGIAGAVAVAITAHLMRLFFLSGKTITGSSFIGRIVHGLWNGLTNFATGWREQNLRYKLIAYPCMIVSMGLTSVMIYWFAPVVGGADFWNALRYCLLIVLVGVCASVIGAFLLIYLIFLAGALIGAWWNRDKTKPAAADSVQLKKDEPSTDGSSEVK